jgi:hypothetical protein
VENVLNPIYFFINEWRNSEIIQDKKLREAMLPKLSIPEKFNLLTENIIQDQIGAARKADVSDDIIAYLELDFIIKKFANNQELRDKLLATKKLDPLATKTEQNKSDLLLSGVLTKFDVVKSTYIDYFIDCALEDNDKFFTLDKDKQIELIDKYTNEKLMELDGESSPSLVDSTIDPLTGLPVVVQVEDPKNKGFDMSGAPMKKIIPPKLTY